MVIVELARIRPYIRSAVGRGNQAAVRLTLTAQIIAHLTFLNISSVSLADTTHQIGSLRSVT
jgi:hypothetical protein